VSGHATWSEVRRERAERRSLVTAVVLAGGRSSRFGSDKLAAGLRGRPLLAHALAAAATVADEVVVVAAPDAAPAIPPLPIPVRVVHDPEAYGGPLVGTLAGARAARGERLLVVAGDMPGLAPAVLRALLEATAGGASAVHLGRSDPEARPQPLPFAARTDDVRLAAPVRLAEGDRSLRGLLAALHATVLPEAVWRPLDPAGRTLDDIDTPEDLTSRGD
jgi:molybdopterin-guanine dinucleotide biosynthesis protein A